MPLIRSARERRFENLARTAGPQVLAYLTRRCTPTTDAADLHQRVLLTAWRRLDDLPPTEKEQVAWMIGCARHELANHRRSETRRSAAVQRLSDLIRTAPTPAGEPGHGIDGLLCGLDPLDREIVTLIYWEGLTSTQVAAVVGLSADAVRKRLQRAKERMKAMLSAGSIV